jgi:hypothetical protein
MRPAMLDGERLGLTGRRICDMENSHAVRRPAKAGHLRAVWVCGPLRGREYYLTAAGEAQTAARRGRLP